MINLIKKLYYEKYTKKSYSISNVDLIIDRMFSKVEKGVFIDLGCNHPIKFNNTYLLYKRGWRGINIDLDPKNIRLFNLERPKEINICKCVSSNNSKKDLFFFHPGSPINSLEKKTTKDKSNFFFKKN